MILQGDIFTTLWALSVFVNALEKKEIIYVYFSQ